MATSYAPVSAMSVVTGSGKLAPVSAIPVVVITDGSVPVGPGTAQYVVEVDATYPRAPVAPIPIVYATGAPPVAKVAPIPVFVVAGGFTSASSTGYTKAPGYPGSLTPAGAVTSGNTYNYLDFPTGMALTSISNVTFNGCRFQSNSVGGANVALINCTNIVFNYCTVCPLVSKAATPTHPGVWPSAGAGLPVAGLSEAEFGPYMIPGANGYQYGIRIGGATGTAGTIINHCDIWGFGNSVDFVGALDGIVRDTWIHDAANPVPQDYHTDGPGYLDGLGGRSNILIERCTIASLGNTNAIAFQVASTPYNNIVVQDCFISGFGYAVDMCHNVAGNTGMRFERNTFGTDIRWGFGPMYNDYITQFQQASNVWRGNKLKVLAGSTPASASLPLWAPADDGKFVWPDGSYHATDFEA